MDMCVDDLLEQAIMAIRAAMHLNKHNELAKALAAIAQEMEVP
jgi:hypothetical protein